MTIGIGLLCESGKRILLSADTLVTYTSQGQPVTSNESASKFYRLPHNFACCIADDNRIAVTLVSQLASGLNELDPNDPNLTDRVRAALEAAYDFAYMWMRGRLLRQEVQITEDEYLHDKNLIPSKRRKADKLLKQMQPPVDILLAGFSLFHQSPILLLGEQGKVDEIPDYAVIGSGSEVGLHWLNVRGQRVHMSTPQSYYHIKEASFFCSHNPTVGGKSHVAFLAPGYCEMLAPQPGITANLAEDWWKHIGPKDTGVLNDDRCRKQFEDYFGVPLPPKKP